jgi:hypothetical protein
MRALVAVVAGWLLMAVLAVTARGAEVGGEAATGDAESGEAEVPRALTLGYESDLLGVASLGAYAVELLAVIVRCSGVDDGDGSGQQPAFCRERGPSLPVYVPVGLRVGVLGRVFFGPDVSYLHLRYDGVAWERFAVGGTTRLLLPEWSSEARASWFVEYGAMATWMTLERWEGDGERRGTRGFEQRLAVGRQVALSGASGKYANVAAGVIRRDVARTIRLDGETIGDGFAPYFALGFGAPF